MQDEFYSFSISFRVADILSDPALEDKLQKLKKTFTEQKASIPGVVLCPESFSVYFAPNDSFVDAQTMQEMFQAWSRSIRVESNRCPVVVTSLKDSKVPSPIVQPGTLDSSVRVHLCISNWIRAKYPKIWEAMHAPIVPSGSDSTSPASASASAASGGENKEEQEQVHHLDLEEEEEAELPRRLSPEGVLHRIVQDPACPKQWKQLSSLLNSTLSVEEYRKLAKEHHRVSEELAKMQETSKKYQRPLSAWMHPAQLRKFRKRMEDYNAHIAGYQLLTPHFGSVSSLLEQIQRLPGHAGSCDFSVLPSGEVCPFLNHHTERSAQLLHQLNPLVLPPMAASNCEKEAVMRVLDAFRYTLGDWKSRNPVSRGWKLPVKLQVQNKARLAAFNVGDVPSPDGLPSCVALPLFVPFRLHFADAQLKGEESDSSREGEAGEESETETETETETKTDTEERVLEEVSGISSETYLGIAKAHIERQAKTRKQRKVLRLFPR